MPHGRAKSAMGQKLFRHLRFLFFNDAVASGAQGQPVGSHHQASPLRLQYIRRVVPP